MYLLLLRPFRFHFSPLHTESQKKYLELLSAASRDKSQNRKQIINTDAGIGDLSQSSPLFDLGGKQSKTSLQNKIRYRKRSPLHFETSPFIIQQGKSHFTKSQFKHKNLAAVMRFASLGCQKGASNGIYRDIGWYTLKFGHISIWSYQKHSWKQKSNSSCPAVGPYTHHQWRSGWIILHGLTGICDPAVLGGHKPIGILNL